MGAPAAQVLQRFPEHWQLITKLLRTDEAFCLICEDYAQAVTALRRWENSARPNAPERVAEFHELAVDLEREILDILCR